MTEARIRFDMLGFWHMGTGSGKGFHYDAVVAKTPRNLPLIPGRTVKGLMREAVTLLEEAGRTPSGSADRLFGFNDPTTSRYDSCKGLLAFSGAALNPDPSTAAEWSEGLTEFLYAGVASTRIDEKGQAVSRSLRRIEVTIPVTLVATATSEKADTAWVQILKDAAPLVRAVGSHRHRGLGRVRVTVSGAGE